MRGNKGVHGTAIVHPNVVLGKDVHIGPFCIIGAMAENKATWDENIPTPPVIIGDGTVITGHVTIDAGTEGPTRIGNGCFIMKHVHIGHDAQVGNDVTMAPGVCIGGRVTIEDKVNIGMNATVHPRQTLREGAMIGMSTVITKGTLIEAYRKYAGNPAHDLGSNKEYHRLP